MLSFLNVTLVLFLNYFSSTNCGVFSILYLKFMSFLIFANLILINSRNIKSRWSESRRCLKIIEGVLVVAPVVLFMATKNYYFWHALLLLFLIGLFGLKEKDKLPVILLITSVLYFLFILISVNVNLLWLYLDKTSVFVTTTLSRLPMVNVQLGPSVSGLNIFVLFSLFILTTIFIYRSRITVFMKYLIGLIVIHLLILTIFGLYFDSALKVSNLQVVFFIGGLIPVLLLLVRRKSIENSKEYTSGLSNRTRIFIACLVSILTFSLVVSVLIYPTIPTKENKIIFYQKGLLLNWDVPNYDSFTLLSGGMYGMLPRYLEAAGYKVRMTEKLLTQEILDEAKVLVMIVPTEDLGKKEKEDILNWIKEGGSLLLLGDHTDIGDFMKPTNTLLNPFGIQFKFDTTDPATRGVITELSRGIWTSQVELRNHPITYGLVSSNQLQIGGGASLDISFPAYPIILGKYGFSDPGDYSNAGRGGYLGDRIYQRGERLGDLVLVAGRNFGKGKVVVFGDTSTFQNIALPNTCRFVNQIFSYLTSKQFKIVELLTPFRYLGTLLFFSVFLLIIFSKELNFSKILVAILSCAITLGILSAGFVNQKMEKLEEKQILGETAYILASHSGQFNAAPFTDSSVDALSMNLMRNDYLPVVLPHFDRQRISNSKVLVLISPSKPLRRGETSFLKEYMEKGGLVVVSAGFTDQKGVYHLLSEVKLGIEPLPLGPLPMREFEMPLKYFDEPKFINAWPVKIKDGDRVKVFYEGELLERKFPVVVYKEVGKGGILLITDSEFLLNKNLETEKGFWKGNIMLLRQIFEELKE